MRISTEKYPEIKPMCKMKGGWKCITVLQFLKWFFYETDPDMYLEAKPVERKNKWFAIVNRKRNITIQRNLTVLWLYSVGKKINLRHFLPLLERNLVNSSLSKGRQRCAL